MSRPCLMVTCPNRVSEFMLKSGVAAVFQAIGVNHVLACLDVTLIAKHFSGCNKQRSRLIVAAPVFLSDNGINSLPEITCKGEE